MAGSGGAHLRPNEAASVLRVEDLRVEFPARDGRVVQAVSGLSFDLLPGETVGLVGESGCGKSSAARAVMQLPRPSGGSVILGDVDLTQLDGERLRRVRSRMQLIFQDPISSLNPRRRVSEIVAEPLEIWGTGNAASRREQVEEVLEAVGLDPAIAGPKRPHEFSGGQCQRISIARAVVGEPTVLICDEPVSALDVSVQAQILNLLEDMKARFGLSMIFIAHDLAVVRSVSDRVAVMYLGKLCEVGAPERIYARPAHPYTDALLRAVPIPDPAVRPHREPLAGDVPSPLDPPSGCRFRTRCPRAAPRCASEEPQVREVEAGQFVACHYPLVGAQATAA
ncbi:MAG TPA: oligopeptide/dipeptide ABC transporter ATP-binding protein [Acidimicrobiia bacterium]|nr:oligopeptide/dipeptide ABC transporter ATP-binding protein [Acidimicrobiia bacterium]